MTCVLLGMTKMLNYCNTLVNFLFNFFLTFKPIKKITILLGGRVLNCKLWCAVLFVVGQTLCDTLLHSFYGFPCACYKGTILIC